MADLVIRGVKMPKTCIECPFTDYEEGLCLFTGVYALNIGIQADCPIVPLPEGHGRLGDLDALINELQNLLDKREKAAYFSGDRTVNVTWNDAIYHIRAASTIVPAEGRSEE